VTGAVLITGAAARVGRYIAIGLAQDRWTVIIHYNRSGQKAQELVSEINQNIGKAFALGANLSVPAERDNLISEARNLAQRPLNALINNASTFDPDGAADFSRGSFDHHLNVNLYAPLALSREFAAQLPEDELGSIINIIDQKVLNSDPAYFTYSISKSALFTATKTMAQSFAPRIRVNAVGPGPTFRNKAQKDGEFETELSATLLGIGSPPDTIVDGIRYLLSASSVTGQMIAIDGGQHLNWTNGDLS